MMNIKNIENIKRIKILITFPIYNTNLITQKDL